MSGGILSRINQVGRRCWLHCLRLLSKHWFSSFWKQPTRCNNQQSHVLEQQTPHINLTPWKLPFVMKEKLRRGGDQVALFLFTMCTTIYALRNNTGLRKNQWSQWTTARGRTRTEQHGGCCLFVEFGHCNNVTALFLVAGNTENACDRLFNKLKLHHRSENVNVLKALMKLSNWQEHIAACHAQEDNALDFELFENRLCLTNLEPNTIDATQLFHSVNAKAGHLCCSKSVTAEAKVQRLIKRIQGGPAEKQRLLLALPNNKDNLLVREMYKFFPFLDEEAQKDGLHKVQFHEVKHNVKKRKRQRKAVQDKQKKMPRTSLVRSLCQMFKKIRRPRSQHDCASVHLTHGHVS